MASTAHQTRALLLRSHPLRESDRLVELFTREFGLIHAVAKSAREERSKLRYALEPHSLIEVTLVRGKEVWRVRGASSVDSFYRLLKGDSDKVRVAGSILALLSRLLAGEEQNQILFDLIEEALGRLPELSLSKDELKAFESIVVLRILSLLGYKLLRPEWNLYLEAPLTRELCEKLLPERRSVVLAINEALTETQL